MSGVYGCTCDLCTAQRTGNYSAFAEPAKRQRLSADTERAMRIAWKVQLSEDTRQRKLAMRASSAEIRAAAVMKRMRKAERRQAEARRG